MTGWQAAAPRLVLASSSATRLALLTRAGIAVQVQPAAVDEAVVKQAARAEGRSPADAALLLADLKAARVARSVPDALVIGADQILECDGRWFDKPADPDQARDHLLALRGRAHTLHTAVACHRGGPAWHHVASPRLTMRPFSDAFLDSYLSAEGAAVCASVGAYRLEGLGIHLFASVEGEHAAVLGLPLLALLDFLRQHGVIRA